MFTGIIEDLGTIRALARGPAGTVTIDVQSPLKVAKGESIAIQGICLTVTGAKKKGFTVQSMVQTRVKTSLPQWKTGDNVNLERALPVNGRLGGHIMLGHVDEVGRVVRIAGNAYYIQVDARNAGWLVDHGSIGVDGVSLTISSISQNIFAVSLIPLTLQATTLRRLRVRSPVNIEYDYLVKILKPKK